MLEEMQSICSAPLLRALVFPGGIPAAQPLEVRDWFGAQLDELLEQGRALGLEEGDLEEACYALVAFIDEQVLRSSWPGREEWMRQPLQLQRYRENVAGENFFRRLRRLLQSPRRLPAIQVYALCLALGFRGAYQHAGTAAPLGKFQRAAFRRLAAALPSPEVSSPHLVRPERPPPRRAAPPLLRAMLVTLPCVVLVLAACSWSVRQAAHRSKAMTSADGGSAP